MMEALVQIVSSADCCTRNQSRKLIQWLIVDRDGPIVTIVIHLRYANGA